MSLRSCVLHSEYSAWPQVRRPSPGIQSLSISCIATSCNPMTYYGKVGQWFWIQRPSFLCCIFSTHKSMSMGFEDAIIARFADISVPSSVSCSVIFRIQMDIVSDILSMSVYYHAAAAAAAARTTVRVSEIKTVTTYHFLICAFSLNQLHHTSRTWWCLRWIGHNIGLLLGHVLHTLPLRGDAAGWNRP